MKLSRRCGPLPPYDSYYGWRNSKFILCQESSALLTWMLSSSRTQGLYPSFCMLNGLTLINGISIWVPKPMNCSAILHVWTYIEQHYTSYESKSGHSDLGKRGFENFIWDCNMNLLDENLAYVSYPKHRKENTRKSPANSCNYFYGIHGWCSVLL